MKLDHGSIQVGQYLTKMLPKEFLEKKLSLAIANDKGTVRAAERIVYAIDGTLISESTIC